MGGLDLRIPKIWSRMQIQTYLQVVFNKKEEHDIFSLMLDGQVEGEFGVSLKHLI